MYLARALAPFLHGQLRGLEGPNLSLAAMIFRGRELPTLPVTLFWFLSARRFHRCSI